MEKFTECLIGRAPDPAETALQRDQLARLDAGVMRNPLLRPADATPATTDLQRLDISDAPR